MLVFPVAITPPSKFVGQFINVVCTDTNEGFTDISQVHISPEFLFNRMFDIGFKTHRFITQEILNHLPVSFDCVSSENIRYIFFISVVC